MRLRQTLLLVLWPLLSLALLGIFTWQRVVAFDPADRLASADAEQSITRLFQQTYDDIQQTGFVVSAEACQCNNFNAPLERQMHRLLSEQDYSVRKVVLNADSELRRLIPSVPALVVFDAEQHLRYVGPMSAGYVCTPATNEIAGLVAGIIGGQYLGAQINNLTSGCYCHT